MRFRKWYIGIAAGVLVLGLAGLVSAATTMKLVVNGKTTDAKVPPQFIDNTLMVPAQTLIDALGLEINWNVNTNTLMVTGGDPKALANELSDAKKKIADLEAENTKLKGDIAKSKASASSASVTVTSGQVTEGAEAEPIAFKGKGQQVSPVIELEAGVYVVKTTHDGKRNFAIVTRRTNGEYIQLLVNTIGTFDGSKMLVIEDSGKFMMDITADGEWTVSITPAE